MTLSDLTDQLVRLHVEQGLTPEIAAARELELRTRRREHGGDTTIPAREIREAVTRVVAADGLGDAERDRVFGAMVRREVEHAESRTLVESAAVPLLEQAGENGSALIKIIQPGWGAAAWYGEAMLRRDGPRVFTQGTHMLWNHPTSREEADRPWGDLYDLAGVLTENARWEPSGTAGPGLYAEAKIFGSFRERLAEIASDIGISIRAYGRGSPGEAEGRKGIVLDELVEAISIDFVPRAGAGGEVVQLFEAARRPRPDGIRELAGFSMSELRELLTTGLRAILTGEHRWIWVVDFTDGEVVYEDEGDDAPDPGYFQRSYSIESRQVTFADDVTKVTRKTVWVPVTAPRATTEGGDPPHDEEDAMSKELEARIAELEKERDETRKERDEARTNEQRAREAVLAREARDAAGELVAEHKLPALAKTRITEQVSASPPVKDGTLDRDALKQRVEEVVKAEAEYLASITGNGQVRDLGEGTTTTDTALSEARLNERIARFRKGGLSEEAARAAAVGR